MKTYTIYHITGKKIGCSDEPDKRVEAQGYTHYEILEQHTDIYLASDREQELQREYGYKVDKNPYYKSVEARQKTAAHGGSVAGKINGIKARDSGQLLAAAINGGKTQGRKKVESGQIYEMQKKAAEVRRIPISAYLKHTGTFVGNYPSQNECAIKLGLNIGSISMCINGKLKSTGGYTFKLEQK